MPNRRHRHKRPPGPLLRKRAGAKGSLMRKIIGAGAEPGREYYLHATKGYRSRRNPVEA